jgi:outer membrane protein OmpA-like peptidoglycan-associated protein
VKKDESDEAALQYKTESDGSFSVPLEKGYNYGIDIEKDGYVFASNTIDLTKNAKTLPKYEEKVVLKKPTLGTKFVLKNIVYKTGNASLEHQSFNEIDLLGDFLIKNPTIKIEISGHTDNRGTPEVNKELSTSRARAIYKLLIKKGIEGERIKYIGYGSERPVASNDSEAGRKQNRRTEFEIIYR